ncbi:Hydroxyisourate hydrolase [Xylona heveae TC161]|uniref:5-hydroxyisourate hydrolase n=1 Tax=Xylona heveae (strain CBS 132557 / TC161) TaxID=1328760 RepID=A0A164ZFP7_XYLHT|nr:Hydroxyisourate hydrolase [Xylona heveae TC161]KZF19044.1 Hydroxyisourate hydrolase [Xylona heveae TC161]
MAAQEKPPITCHVLDTIKGRPAASIAVTLTLLQPYGPSAPFTGLTNSDGRVTVWTGEAGPSLREIFHNAHEHEGARLTWSLKFDTGSYFGEGNTFFPEVEIRFFTTNQKEHYHVPLLLGPWSYTTYRGS